MQVYQEIKGVVIGSVQPGSPADKLGLQARSRIWIATVLTVFGRYE